MSKQFVQNKHQEGDAVYAKVDPSVKLIVTRYLDQIYYCQIAKYPEKKELVYFERELFETAPVESGLVS